MDSAQDRVPPPAPALPVQTSQAPTVDAEIHQRLMRDYRRLKNRVEALENENESLRASLWEVSWRWGKRDKSKGGKARQGDEDGPVDAATSELANGTAPAPTAPSASAHAASSVLPNVELTPRQTPTRATNGKPQSDPSTVHAPLVPPPPSTSDFMKLNEPIKIPTAVAAASAHLPNTPSSLAASLFPSTSGGTTTGATSAAASAAPSAPTSRPPAPSSTSSRTAPAIRDASLQRQLDIPPPSSRNPMEARDARESWRWTRAYELKGHRGAVYNLKFGDGEVGTRGRVLASAAFDGVRLWAAREEASQKAEAAENEEQGDPWDDGDIEELVHLSAHSGPVSDVAFSPSMSHLVSGGYDSQVFVHSLSSLTSKSEPPPASAPVTPSPSGPPSPSSLPSQPVTSPIWSIHTEGLVQSVAWLQPQACQGSESGNVFAWGTSGRVLAVGDMRMPGGDNARPAMEVHCEGMINSVQSFRQSPNLLIGDSLGAVRHFSLRANAFVPFSDLSASAAAVASGPSTGATSKKGPPPISCLSVNPDWGGRKKGGEGRWMASVGFDNLIRIYDRGSDPLKMIATPPKLVHTLKGKNRNWPIKSAWFQGRNYMDAPPPSKRRAAGTGGTASRTRSRSASFSSDRQSPDYSSDEDGDDSRRHRHHRPRKEKEADDEPRQKPLSSSMLLAVGSSDPVVLLYDLSGISDGATSASAGGNGNSSTISGAGPPNSSSATTSSMTSAGSSAPKLLQRLEGHKESVYAVDFLQAADGEEGDEAVGSSYRGPGLLASSGGDWVVRLWKPEFREEN